MDAKAIAYQTIAALEAGEYLAPDGNMVDIRSLLVACINGTRCYEPEELAMLAKRFLVKPEVSSAPITIAVVNETTLQGCARLVASRAYQRIGVLNFASAKNPGGGFLKGAKAQEESLARSSGLYWSLRQCPDWYAFHRSQDTSLYSDRMIYSPACPVLRNDSGKWLASPYLVDFITSPAPNAGAVLRNEPHRRAEIVPVLIERASKILALAAEHDCDALVLGAWGCGVFQNNPAPVAAIFADHLSRYEGYFRHILFSVYDSSPKRTTYQAFAHQFASCELMGNEFPYL